MARSSKSVPWTKESKKALEKAERGDVTALIDPADIEAIAKLGEDLLSLHISKDIYGVDIRGANTWGGLKYPRRYQLDEEVYSYLEGTTIIVTTRGAPSPSVVGRKGGSPFYDIEQGGFLAMLNDGNLGFLTNNPERGTRYGASFPRPAITNAQAVVDSPAFQQKIKAIINK